MTRQRARRGAEPKRPWIKDVPNWLTAIASIAAVATTATLGAIELGRGSNEPTASTPRPTVSPTGSAPAASLLASGAAAGGGAPPADAGSGGAERQLPNVTTTAFGWEDDVLRFDGTVSDVSGPLWLAIQPKTADESSPWSASEMEFDLPPDWSTVIDWYAEFHGVAPAEGYRLKVFQDGYGFGAGGGPEVQSFGEFLESGGADRPSRILETEVNTANSAP